MPHEQNLCTYVAKCELETINVLLQNDIFCSSNKYRNKYKKILLCPITKLVHTDAAKGELETINVLLQSNIFCSQNIYRK